MRKILRLCIVLAMLGITYKYIETVGVYQTEVAKVQKIGANNGGLIEAVIITAESDWADIRDIINNRRENEKAIAIYYPLLAEYERAWKDKDYYDEYGYIISDYRFRYLRNSLEYNSLWYALFDIANDGTEELIIGVNFGEKYIISTLYSYDNDSVHCAYMGPDGNGTLYEMGIYKVYIEMRGAGVFEYYQFKKDLIQAEFVIGLTQSFIDGKYYKNTELNNSNETEITEEEFRKIREQYEKNLIELEWQKLSGYDKDS